MGATLSAGALLVTQVSGSEALSGMAATGTTVGAAIAAIPLAALAHRAGRAPSLATGALIAAAGAGSGWSPPCSSLPLLLVALVMIGVGTAVNLQSRFAATDLSEPGDRGRDLAVVVWATTVGAVLGPNLIAPADAFGREPRAADPCGTLPLHDRRAGARCRDLPGLPAARPAQARRTHRPRTRRGGPRPSSTSRSPIRRACAPA